MHKRPELSKEKNTFKTILDSSKGATEDFDFLFDTSSDSVSTPEVNPILHDSTEPKIDPEKLPVIPANKHTGKFLKDTLIKTQGRFTIKLWQAGKEIRVKVIERDTVRILRVPVSSQIIVQNSCEHEPTWYDLAAYTMAVLFLVMVGALFLIKVPK